MGLVTLIALLYVKQQLEVVTISYDITSCEQQLGKLLDQHKSLKYNVLALKSIEDLENKLRTHNVVLAFTQPEQVIRVAALAPPQYPKREISFAQIPRGISNIFSFNSQAEAVSFSSDNWERFSESW
jgi:hypothetical protein